MNLLLKSVRIIDKGNPLNGKKVDLLIKNGKIEKIGSNLKSDSKIKEVKKTGLCISKGWMDLLANFHDPGNEHKEDIQSALAAASSGGFTKVCVSAATEPARDSKGQVDYLTKATENHLVDALPYGSLSKDLEGKEIAEYYDLKEAGAIAFSDDRKSVKNPNLLKNALLYASSMNGLIVNFPYQSDLSPKGVVNEGASSTSLGLKGIPLLAEEIMVQRDLYLLAYTEGRLHLSTLSSSKSVDLISEAKKKGLTVSCDIASYNLLLNDEELKGYDTRFKTMPPLRSKKEVKELIKRVKKGMVDALCSNHSPEELDAKKKEFDLANYGAINLQTAVPAAITALKNEMPIEDIIYLFTDGPAKVLGIATAEIKEGEKADLTLFDPEESFEFSKDMVVSKSNNSPFFGRELNGKVYGLINNDQAELHF